MLFGDDFPSLASKQADLSCGLSKTLSSNAGRQFPGSSQRFGSRPVPTRNLFNSGSLTTSKYSQTRPLFVIKGRSKKNQLAPSSMEAYNLVVLSIVNGFQIDFHSTPAQSCPPVTREKFSETQLISAEV